MRAPILVLILLSASVSLAPYASADAQPGCDESVRVEEVCDVYGTKREIHECVKDLRWCIIGPI